MNNQIIKSNNICNLFFGITTFCTVISSTNFVSAQITPDNTLPNNSEVGIEGNITKIEGGTTAGSNLFHSFEKFGVSTGAEVHFNNSVDIQNIFTRVTGKSISNVDGLIKANGAANLFLINPNGILFGQNARLDIGGSFVGSSAESLIFPNNLEFSAVNPVDKPLLSVNVPLGLQYGKNPGNISVKGDGEGIRKSSEIIDTQNGLRVKPDKTLGLIGGDMNLEGATLKTAGGRIELGSVKGDLVNIISIEKGFSFGYDAVKNGGDINLSQQAAVDTSGEGAGDIQVWGKNIKLVGDSQIETSTLGSENGGNLVVNAQDSVEIIGTSSSIFSVLVATVYPEATGNGGNLTINTQNLLVRNGGGVGTTTLGKGNSGNLNINALKIELIGTNIEDNKSNIILSRGGLSTSSQPIKIENEGQVTINPDKLLGDAGDLTINTDSLIVKDGAQISTATSGSGKGGNLNINARDIQLIGSTKVNGIPIASGLFSSSEPVLINQGTEVTFDFNTLLGNAGDLNINASSLTVKDGAQVSTFTSGNGNSGNLKIITNKLLVENGGIIYSSTFGEGKGGNLTVDAQKVELIGGDSDDIFSDILLFNTGLSTSSRPIIEVENSEKLTFDINKKLGNAGNLEITIQSLLVKNGAQITTNTRGKGNAGNLTVNAKNVKLIGRTSDNLISSRLSATARPALPINEEREATFNTPQLGDAGNLNINTDTLLVEEGAFVSTQTLGKGDGGDLNINADDIQLIGTNPVNGDIIGGLTTSAGGEGIGNAGNLTINTNSLLVKDGAQVSTITTGKGKSGNLTVNARDIQLIGTTPNAQFSSGLFAQSQPLTVINSEGKLVLDIDSNKLLGDAGNLNINADTLLVKDGAVVSVDSLGEGIAGNIDINADSVQLDKGNIFAITFFTNGGNINLDIADLLLMRNGSQISSTSGSRSATGDGGNININSPNGFIVATPNQNNDITANAFQGKGGRVKIDAAGIFGMNSVSRNELEKLSPDDLNPYQLPTNDITAISQQNPDLSGFIEIITPEISPENALTQLPTTPVDTTITNTCSNKNYAQSSFTITGKGSLPPSPFEPLTGRVNQTKLATLDEVEETKLEPRSSRQINKKPEIKQIVEAQGWIRNKNGEIFLVANPPQNNNYQTQSNSNNCS